MSMAMVTDTLCIPSAVQSLYLRSMSFVLWSPTHLKKVRDLYHGAPRGDLTVEPHAPQKNNSKLPVPIVNTLSVATFTLQSQRGPNRPYSAKRAAATPAPPHQPACCCACSTALAGAAAAQGRQAAAAAHKAPAAAAAAPTAAHKAAAAAAHKAAAAAAASAVAAAAGSEGNATPAPSNW